MSSLSTVSEDSVASGSVVTPLPWRVISVLFVVLAAEMTAMQVVVPFAPFMVQSFGLVDDEAEIGYWVGWLLAAFPFAQVLSAYPWGALSDRWGRVRCITAGLAGTAIFLFLFGFSDRLWKATLLRFLAGLANGNLGVVKSLLGEITDETNQAKAFAIFGLATSVGVVVGPMVGGSLANIAEKSSWFATPFFRVYPYFLPSGVIAVVVLVWALVTPFILPSNPSHWRKEQSSEGDEAEVEALVNEEIGEVVSSSPSTNSLKTQIPARALYSVVAYGLCAFQYAVIDDLFPVWSMQGEGRGLSYSTSDVGKAFSIKGLGLFLFGPFVVPPLQRFLGTPRMLILAAATSILFGLTPDIALLPRTFRWHFVWLLMLAMSGIGNAQFTASMLAINESSPKNQLGTVNGIGQSAAALARTTGPLVATFLFSWSLEAGLPFPFDIHLAFLVSSAVAVGGILAGIMIRRNPARPSFELQ